VKALADSLRHGASVLDVGCGNGDIEGEPMDGVPFHYYSFSVEGYREVLRDHGFTLIDTHVDCGRNIYYLATRDAG
jgi:hypothetical protein